jgi:hypothetical protein
MGSKRFANRFVVCDDRAQPTKGVEMPYALSRPWLVVLGVALLVALFVIGTALGVGPLGPAPDAPSAMPPSCPPVC